MILKIRKIAFVYLVPKFRDDGDPTGEDNDRAKNRRQDDTHMDIKVDSVGIKAARLRYWSLSKTYLWVGDMPTG